jgi:hypothetical protein
MASEADKYRIDSDMSVAELDELIKDATEQKAKAKKKEKAKAVQTVKELIQTYDISSGDLRGKTMNILNAKKR